MPGLTIEDDVARLASDGAGGDVAAALAAHGLRLDAVRPAGADHVCAWLDADGYRISITFVVRGDAERDALALLDVLQRPPATWDARWAGTSEATRDVRPGIAGARWRMAQS